MDADRFATTIYAVRMAIYVVFAFACFWRAYENHVEHERLRWSLVLLGIYMLGDATVLGFRIVARSMDTLAEQRLVLGGPWFFLAEVLTTIAVVALFFVLQKPRAT